MAREPGWRGNEISDRVGARSLTGVWLVSRILFEDDHSSGPAVADGLEQPTRSSNGPGRPSLLIWPCTRWGLPCPGGHPSGGALLPHLFTLTGGVLRGEVNGRHSKLTTQDSSGGLFSVALSLDASSPKRRAGVTRHRALPCSDFPRSRIGKPAQDRGRRGHTHGPVYRPKAKGGTPKGGSGAGATGRWTVSWEAEDLQTLRLQTE